MFPLVTKTNKRPIAMPTPDEIKTARLTAALSQAEAADLVGLGSAHRWSEYERGAKNISIQTWRLFLLLTRQEKLPSFRRLTGSTKKG
jgi:DNA-binding transcriptional regulator YiaG